MILRLFFKGLRVSEGLNKSKTYWLASILVEAGVGQDTGSCMPSKLGNVTPLFINVRK